MNVYLAARYGRRDEMRDVARRLEDAGHLVTSRWVTDAEGVDDATMSLQERAVWAAEDLAGIDAADVVVVFTEDASAPAEWRRGGRHVELGYAIARAKEIVVVGPPETIFHVGHAHVETVDSLVRILGPLGVWRCRVCGWHGRRAELAFRGLAVGGDFYSCPECFAAAEVAA